MQKLTLQKLTLMCSACVLTAGAALAEGDLNIGNWSDYITGDTIASFEAATGIKVSYDVFDSSY